MLKSSGYLLFYMSKQLSHEKILISDLLCVESLNTPLQLRVGTLCRVIDCH